MARHDLSGFWAELSACEHFVQIYEHDDAFLNTLADFVQNGLSNDGAAIVIVTPAHREGLEDRLEAMGIDLAACGREDRFIALDAEETLGRFMVKGWPDDELFASVIQGILRQARGAEGRRIVAFGEMVAVLWLQGLSAATVRLEYLWKEICERKLFRLFCAYPRIGFTEDPAASIARLCELHSKILTA